jgi:hypothetical protein
MTDDTLVEFTTTVPKSRVGDLAKYAASLYGPPAAAAAVTPVALEARVDNGKGVSDDALKAAGPGLTEEAVRRNYTGGDSEYWRPFLKLLAHEPAQWVHWPKLHNALGLKNTEAAGMLGAAERRCKGFPPYVKSKDEGEHYFWMPSDTAELIIQLATE